MKHCKRVEKRERRMQHLDEGTIHSWLDGVLSGDEAARVDAHVKECPECAAAVAEARGFIAASSRILTALDNAPRGVIPAAAPKRRIDPFVWRVAATVMVVAVGTLVVVRSSGRETEMATTSADTASNTLKAVEPMSIGDERTPEPTPPMRIQGGSTQRTPAIASERIARSLEKSAARTAVPDKVTTGNQAVAASPQVTDSKEEGAGALQSKTPVRENSAGAAQALSAIVPGAVPSSGYAGVEPRPPVMLRGKVGGVAAEDARSEIIPLKVIGTPRQIGAKVTLYEVAPGDTVTLTEVNAQLSEMVTTGIAMAAPQEARSAAKSGAVASPQRADPPAANAPDSQSATSPFVARRRAPSAPAAITAVEVANGVTTITWPDAITGNVLKLSGRIPETRLQRIKLRIERERAAAAAKKNP
jgi:anti-sigma factor RsiW